MKDDIKKNKKIIIASIIIWILVTVIIVIPFAYGFFAATCKGKGFMVNVFMQYFGAKFLHPFEAIAELLNHNGLGTLMMCELVFTIIYVLIFLIGLKKSNSNHEYYNIEHGSSDWSKGGEQYQILNKKEGIILGENNYLPVDKRGNVNVLVVGRFWFW